MHLSDIREQLTKTGYLPNNEIVINPSFFCVYQYEVIPVFANAPKEFFTLIKMRKSIEENRFRLKVYRMIVKK